LLLVYYNCVVVYAACLTPLESIFCFVACYLAFSEYVVIFLLLRLLYDSKFWLYIILSFCSYTYIVKIRSILYIFVNKFANSFHGI